MNQYTFYTILIVMGLFGWLIYAALQGSILAIVTLSAIVAVALVLIGTGVNMANTWVSSRREQQNFANNTKENLMMMQAMMRAMEQQNRMARQQLMLEAQRQKAQQPQVKVEDDFPALPLIPGAYARQQPASSVVDGEFIMTGFDD
jgi:mannitol-specific phosphotransferase system IIBC component